MESIKNFLKQISEFLYYKIKDSAFYNILIEKYENLDPYYQKWIKEGFIFLSGLLVTILIFSIFFSSAHKSEEFKVKKTLVNQMIQIPVSIGISAPITAIQWNEKINQLIDDLSLSDDQIVKIAPYRPSQSKIPQSLKSLTHIGKKIQIEGLNIQEIMDIGYALDQMDSSVKLTQLQIEQVSFITHYFKATYFVFLFFNPSSRKSTRK